MSTNRIEELKSAIFTAVGFEFAEEFIVALVEIYSHLLVIKRELLAHSVSDLMLATDVSIAGVELLANFFLGSLNGVKTGRKLVELESVYWLAAEAHEQLDEDSENASQSDQRRIRRVLMEAFQALSLRRRSLPKGGGELSATATFPETDAISSSLAGLSHSILGEIDGRIAAQLMLGPVEMHFLSEALKSDILAEDVTTLVERLMPFHFFISRHFSSLDAFGRRMEALSDVDFPDDNSLPYEDPALPELARHDVSAISAMIRELAELEVQ